MIGDHETVVWSCTNDAVVQGLSQLPFMQERGHWGVLTIGTGSAMDGSPTVRRKRKGKAYASAASWLAVPGWGLDVSWRSRRRQRVDVGEQGYHVVAGEFKHRHLIMAFYDPGFEGIRQHVNRIPDIEIAKRKDDRMGPLISPADCVAVRALLGGDGLPSVDDSGRLCTCAKAGHEHATAHSKHSQKERPGTPKKHCH